jgi:hypothetical protein
MSAHRLLVVTTADVPPDRVRDEVARHTGEESPEVRIVSAASDVSRLEWLANDEDAARREAEDTAGSAAAAVGGEAEVVDAGAGSTDPVEAIEDALREWPADEVLLVTPPDHDANWLETGAGAEARTRIGVPVTHVAARAT